MELAVAYTLQDCSATLNRVIKKYQRPLSAKFTVIDDDDALFTQTLSLYKSFTYLLIYLLTITAIMVMVVVVFTY